MEDVRLSDTLAKEIGLRIRSRREELRLTREELAQKRRQLNPSVFFSPDLCAHYFTYMSRQNGAHFVLFDDAGSIRKKLQIARSLNIADAVLAYPQVEDLLEEMG